MQNDIRQRIKSKYSAENSMFKQDLSKPVRKWDFAAVCKNGFWLWLLMLCCAMAIKLF